MSNLQFSFKVVSPDGFSHLIVWNEDLTHEVDPELVITGVISHMQETERALLEEGYRPLSNGYDKLSYPVGSSQTAAPPDDSLAPDPGDIAGRVDWGQYWPEHEGVDLGTLDKILVENEKGKTRLAFYLSNRSKPIYNYGIPDPLTLFKEDCWTETWTKEHLDKVNQIYTPGDFGKLEGLSGKSKERGYWDVLKIRVKPE